MNCKGLWHCWITHKYGWFPCYTGVLSIMMAQILYTVLSWLALVAAVVTDDNKLQCAKYTHNISETLRVTFEGGQLVINTTDIVYHMEEDALRDGFIMYSSSRAILTTNGTKTHILTGNGTTHTAGAYSSIKAFLQLGLYDILIADYEGSLISTFNYETESVFFRAGMIRKHGFIDGIGEDARLNKPSALVRHPENGDKMLFIDEENKAVRQLDMTDNSVVTLFTTVETPRGMTRYGDDHILIEVYYGVLMHDLSNNKTTDDFKGERGYDDGKISEATFWYPSAIVVLPSKLVVVGELLENRLRLIDFELGVVSTLSCEPSIIGALTPRSLFWAKNKIYVGNSEHVYSISAIESRGLITTPTIPPINDVDITNSATTTLRSSTTVLTRNPTKLSTDTSKPVSTSQKSSIEEGQQAGKAQAQSYPFTWLISLMVSAVITSCTPH